MSTVNVYAIQKVFVLFLELATKVSVSDAQSH